jgi:hypothetical protein
MTAERPHSKLGASKAARWLACPGSVALCATLPEPPSSPHARQGSAAHYVAEQCLLDAKKQPRQFVGKPLPGFEEIKFSKEDAEAVTVYVDLCRKTMANYPDGRAWIEAPFALLDYDAELFGHNDFAFFNPVTGQLVVADYKHGAGVTVGVERNPQLMYYALGAMSQIPSGVREVHIVVVQPRANGDDVKRWQTDPMTLLEFGGELAEGAERTRQSDAPLCPGTHCQFCPAKQFAACPALAAEAERVVLDEFADVSADIEKVVSAAEPDTLAELLERVPLVRMWCKAIEDHAKREALQGRSPTGFKLVHARAKREWQDGDQAMAAVLEALPGLELADVYEQVPLSPAGLEKLVGKGTHTLPKIFAAHLAKPKPGYALVPLSDKREPVPPPSESEFDEIGALPNDDE